MALATVPSTESAASPSKKPSPVVSGLSLAGIVIADLVLKRAFLRAGLAFPSSLAGMVGLFAGTVRRVFDHHLMRTWPVGLQVWRDRMR